ncbi:MAG TPA: SDR family oxidoreductase [Nitrospiria bacterium]|nr:SDR family oxidoreductase [Nitrospiria bacterium]
MHFRLKDKVALVTGGGRGIGRQIALAFAAEGAHVAIAARTEREIKPVAERITGLGRRALAVPTDVADEARVAALVAETERAFGRIDILVNSAAVVLIEPLAKTTAEQWRRTMDVNVTGAFFATRAVLPGMTQRNEGRIINISSTAGIEGFANFSAFCASKFALIGLTRALAKELEGSPVTANALCPALVGTKRVAPPPKGSAPAPEPFSEIADVAVFLAGERGRAVSGAAIEISWRT